MTTIARRVDQQLAFAAAQLAVANANCDLSQLQQLSIKQAVVLQLALALDLYAKETSPELPAQPGALQLLLSLSHKFPDFRIIELQNLAAQEASCVRTVLDLHQQVTNESDLAEITVNATIAEPAANDSTPVKRDQIIASTTLPPVSGLRWRDTAFSTLAEHAQSLKEIITRHRETNSEA